MIFTAIDIGNTNIKIGVFINNVFTQFVFFNNLNEAESFLLQLNLSKAAISSVVPSVTEEIKKFIKDKFGFEPFVITKESIFSFDISYETPDTLGYDRICSCEGALYVIKSKNICAQNNWFVVTTDLGTATTVNIVKNGNEFMGGIIAPGLFTMAKSLYKNTAQLPQIEFGSYSSLIGRSTEKAIESGIINATLGLYDKTIEYLKNEKSASEIFFFLTGGNAEYITNHIKGEFTFIKELVILGIKSIYDLNNNER